ncbi:uncharacterized protein LOC126100618 [Schistocerca cancellata]|uniref:uncharacterized protein LOC126100618 n=1 Tax=Schistocerca cancellata TaxID=274614 RepID=UPI0021183A53|nr:uncharacterized protein LOC126100618 [Schistocerca cancellata]
MLFSFPKDADLRWTKVCELHFTESDICRHTECYDEVKGTKLTVKLSRPRLREGAVPSVLPGCPSYLSTPSTSSRESAEERRARLDNEHLLQAIKDSIVTKTEYDWRKLFSTFEAFLQCLERETIPSEWTIVRRSDSVLFLLLTVLPAPSVSVVMTNDLQLSAYQSNTEIRKIGSRKTSHKLSNMNDLFTVLDKVKELVSAKENSLKSQCLLIQDILNDMCSSVDEEKQKQIQFLSEQVKLLCSCEENYRFNPHFSVFCCILHSISPHAYKFLRSSGNLILPHPRTLQKICSSYTNGPHNEQNEGAMLLYIKERFKSLQESDCTISLMMDEIHIKPYFDYKGGNIVGAAFDSDEAATTAYVFMIQSLLSSFKEVVHVLPVRNLVAEQLLLYVKKILCGLYDIGFKVICVVSDNNAINRKSMALFSSPPKLSIVYPHPANPTKPLFFIIDSVHILKCICNNRVNQKDSQVLLKYPQFDGSSDDCQVLMASFEALRQLHKIECNGLLKHSYGLSLQSLYPSSLEKQNVSLVLQVFNEYTAEAISTVGEQKNLLHYQTTA